VYSAVSFAVILRFNPLRELHQLQRLQTRMPVLADDEMVVHGNAERARDLDDRPRHLDVGARGGRVARGMVVQETTGRTIALI
jgi:hypothetical protein